MDKLQRLESALLPLPQVMRQSILRISPQLSQEIEEIRMRIGKPLSVAVGGRERDVTDMGGKTLPVTAFDISFVIDGITRSSLHTAIDSMRHGFLTMQGGHRVGICATAVMKDGAVSMMRNISSLSIRVAKEIYGCSDSVFSRLMQNGCFKDTIVISPPGIGKTTFVRDLCRNLSDAGIRVGIADERSEIAAMCDGKSRFLIGSRTDILDGAPKGIGMLMLLKTMSPHVICADEITAPEDVEAVKVCANCGVGLLVTAHASCEKELYAREVTRSLMKSGIFKQIVKIGAMDGVRTYDVFTPQLS